VYLFEKVIHKAKCYKIEANKTELIVIESEDSCGKILIDIIMTVTLKDVITPEPIGGKPLYFAVILSF